MIGDTCSHFNEVNIGEQNHQNQKLSAGFDKDFRPDFYFYFFFNVRSRGTGGGVPNFGQCFKVYQFFSKDCRPSQSTRFLKKKCSTKMKSMLITCIALNCSMSHVKSPLSTQCWLRPLTSSTLIINFTSNFFTRQQNMSSKNSSLYLFCCCRNRNI